MVATAGRNKHLIRMAVGSVRHVRRHRASLLYFPMLALRAVGKQALLEQALGLAE